MTSFNDFITTMAKTYYKSFLLFHPNVFLLCIYFNTFNVLVSGSFCASIAKQEDDIKSAIVGAESPGTVLELEISDNIPNTKTIVTDSDLKLENVEDSIPPLGKILDITISDSDSSDVPQEESIPYSYIPQTETSNSDLVSVPVQKENITVIPSKNKVLESPYLHSEKPSTLPSTQPETIINEPVKEESKKISRSFNPEVEGVSRSTTAQSNIFTSVMTEPKITFRDPNPRLQSTFNPTTVQVESPVSTFPKKSEKTSNGLQNLKDTEITPNYTKPTDVFISTTPENVDHKEILFSNPLQQNEDEDVFIGPIQQFQIESTRFQPKNIPGQISGASNLQQNIFIPPIEENRERLVGQESKAGLISPAQSNMSTNASTLELKEVFPKLGLNITPPILLSSIKRLIPENLAIVNSTRSDLLSECELNCQKCNATGAVQNGFCLCFSDNGGEVVCLPSKHDTANVREDTGLQLTSEPIDQVEEGDRGQRCSETVGSPNPIGGLRSVLAKGLHQMTPEDRVAEFQKRVEALRSRSALARSKYRANDSPTPAVETPDADLPVSPFRSNPQLPFAVGPPEDSTQNDDAESVKPEEIRVNGNVPQIKLPTYKGLPSSVKRSVNNGPNEGSPIIRFLVPELEDQLANVESIGIMGDFTRGGRFQRSMDSYNSKSSEENSSEYNPLDLKSFLNYSNKSNNSKIGHESMIMYSPNEDAITNLGKHIGKVSQGEMKSLGGILDFAGARTDVRTLVEKIISKSQDGKVATENIVPTMQQRLV